MEEDLPLMSGFLVNSVSASGSSGLEAETNGTKRSSGIQIRRGG